MVYTISGIRLPVVPSACKWSRSTSNGNRNTNLSLLLKDSFSRNVFAGMSSPDSDSSSVMVAATNKILVPGSQGDGSLSLTDQLESPETVQEDPQVLGDVDDQIIEDDKTHKNEVKFVEPTNGYNELNNEQDSASSTVVGDDGRAHGDKASTPVDEKKGVKKDESRPRTVSPPGTGQRIYEIDPFLNNHREHLDYRYGQYKRLRNAIDKHEGGLEVFSRGYEKFGFSRSATGITYREWAPGAKSAALIGDFNNWNPNADIMNRNEFGIWEIFLPNNADGSPPIPHGSRVKIHMDTPSGIKDSIPAWIKYSVQAPGEIPYNGIYYDPPEEERYLFKHPQPKKPKSLRIYESHVGMSSTEDASTYRELVLGPLKI